jgi:hypothetical protein
MIDVDQYGAGGGITVGGHKFLPEENTVKITKIVCVK